MSPSTNGLGCIEEPMHQIGIKIKSGGNRKRKKKRKRVAFRGNSDQCGSYCISERRLRRPAAHTGHVPAPLSLTCVTKTTGIC